MQALASLHLLTPSLALLFWKEDNSANLKRKNIHGVHMHAFTRRLKFSRAAQLFAHFSDIATK